MGSQQLEVDFQDDEVMGADGKGTAPLSYTEVFEQMCPEYMAMGMTYDEYWNGGAELPIYFRKMQKIKNQQRNREFWLQGLYIYEALCDASPLFHDFVKKPKPVPYCKEPYALDEEEKKEKEERKARKEAEKMKAGMKAWMKKINNKRR